VAFVGQRTEPRSGWRGDVASSLAVVRGRPYLWLLGIIGFSLRGGIVLLVLPVIVLPTQVEVRMALGNSLTSTGFSDGFWLLVTGLSMLTLVVMLAILYVLARVEVAAFTRLVDHPASLEQRGGAAPRSLTPGARGRVATRLFAIQSVALVAIMLAAVPLAAAVSDVTIRELVQPSSPDPVYLRVLVQVRELVLLLVGAVVVAELLAAAATRRQLMEAFDLAGHPLETARALRMLGTAVVGWVLFVGAVATGAWLLSVAWQATRSAFLSAAWSSPLEHAVALFSTAMLLSAVFCGALLVCGIVSALRACLWSLASLR
jgi:hypothetical protein